MWKIGNIEINGRVMLAPMAGVTSLGYREFMQPFGVAVNVTEMVSDMGLIYGNEETSEYISDSTGWFSVKNLAVNEDLLQYPTHLGFVGPDGSVD